MPWTQTTTTTDDTGSVVNADTRKLYTLAELKDGKHIEDEPSPIITRAVSCAYQTALDRLSQQESEFWDGRDEIENYIAPELFGRAGITFKAKDATYNVGWGDVWFCLPREALIDTMAFLRAMKAYFAYVDYRGKDYAKSPEKLLASERAQHKIDLRSKDTLIAREQGLVVYVQTAYSSSSGTFDLDYHYDGMSDQFKSDCNDFLAELCHEAARILNADYEDRLSEESCLDLAECNEWLFTCTGDTVVL